MNTLPSDISQQIKKSVSDIPDFPREGIIFKDISPILLNPELCNQIVNSFESLLKCFKFDAIAGIESRGFLFGMLLAKKLNLPFIPIRKKGKLPGITFEQNYTLEYGNACIEIQAGSIRAGQHILVHDDLLATGGTVDAACKLINKVGAKVEACCFLLSLDFLNGRDRLNYYSKNIISLASYC